MSVDISFKYWKEDFKKCRIPADVRSIEISSQSNNNKDKKNYNYYLQLNHCIIWTPRAEKPRFLVPPKTHFDWWEKWQLPARQNRAVLDLKAEGHIQHLQIKNFRSQWHLAVGLGQASVYDNILTLHHIYGIPYLPASSIKGLLRNYMIHIYFQDKEEFALQDNIFQSIFGSVPVYRSTVSNSDSHSYEAANQKGKVIFFDAFPLQAPDIVPDVMTPHYQPYYQGGQPPGDYHDPVIIPFLVVRNTTFQIMIADTEHEIPLSTVNYLPEDTATSLAELTMKMLTNALSDWGIGAKTTCGYGRMTEE